MKDGRDIWWHDADRRPAAGLRAGLGQRRASAVPALHLRLHRQAQGHPAFERGLPARREAHDASGCSTCSEDDVFWCTADIGWVTGHSYVAYGPLAAGATIVMYEGAPTYPDRGTLLADLRIARRHDFLHRAHRDPRAHEAGRRHAGALRPHRSCGCWARWASRSIPKRGCGTTSTSARERCPIVDTWWQTETGAIMISPLPGATATKPGSCTQPLPGIDATIVDAHGKEVQGADAGGYLVIRKPWPSMLRTIWGDNERYLADVLGNLPEPLLRRRRLRASRQGRLFLDHGPHRRRAERRGPPPGHDGNRVRAGRASEGGRSRGGRQAARDQGRIRVRLRRAARATGPRARRPKRSRRCCATGSREQLGAIARPDDIRFADNLPKTRSGKIMRRLLRAIARNEDITQDLSTLENPAIIDQLRGERRRRGCRAREAGRAKKAAGEEGRARRNRRRRKPAAKKPATRRKPRGKSRRRKVAKKPARKKVAGAPQEVGGQGARLLT